MPRIICTAESSFHYGFSSNFQGFQITSDRTVCPLPGFARERRAAGRGGAWEGAVGGRPRTPRLLLQESQASWLDAVVPHLAEVLQLEDTPSIQVEVGVLVRDYPDIR